MTTRQFNPFLGVLIFSTFVFQLGCLQTRSDVKESEKDKALREQVVQYQKAAADSGNRVEELQTQLRQVLGRVEELESESQSRKEDREKNDSDSKEKQSLTQQALSQLEEELKKLKSQFGELQREIEDIKTSKNSKTSKTTKEKNDSTQNVLQDADTYFKNQEWKEAILNYEKYRETNPKGKKLDEATYKIGLCFLELKMSDEAKTFFEEVVRKYPNSSYVKKAKQKLK
ncbi:MAG TPA: tetratricopeptide repeat protein [Pseudobdellovibrionaceae bacterium]|nr:tetratricopeptide repeat protein [Pseudobdellovibrionaceae bacterium]